MKKHKIYQLSLIIAVTLLAFFITTSCSDKGINVPPSELTNNSFFKTNNQFISALGAGYGVLRNVGNYNNIFPDE